MTCVFYVSGHGFGHASRTIEVINSLVDRRPGLRVVVRSAVAPWLVELTARASVELAPTEVDTGVVQIDSLRLDEAATIRHARAFVQAMPVRVAEESRWLRSLAATLVVADIPPLGLAAGRAAGLPTVALGNFTWDWIYRAYDGGAGVADALAAIYAHATVALRLPMHGGFATCPVIRDLPLVARRSRLSREQARTALGLPAGERLVLMSFGGYGVGGFDLSMLSRLEGYRVVRCEARSFDDHSTDVRRAFDERGPMRAPIWVDEQAMYARGLRYEDLVRAVDVVVTKPGYGIIAECVANETAMLYTSRGRFVEYDVLVAAMPRWVRCGFISHDELFAGRWDAPLDRLMALPAPPERPAVNGADVAAALLLEMLPAPGTPRR